MHVATKITVYVTFVALAVWIGGSATRHITQEQINATEPLVGSISVDLALRRIEEAEQSIINARKRIEENRNRAHAYYNRGLGSNVPGERFHITDADTSIKVAESEENFIKTLEIYQRNHYQIALDSRTYLGFWRGVVKSLDEVIIPICLFVLAFGVGAFSGRIRAWRSGMSLEKVTMVGGLLAIIFTFIGQDFLTGILQKASLYLNLGGSASISNSIVPSILSLLALSAMAGALTELLDLLKSQVAKAPLPKPPIKASAS